jgi:hypothetical protein
MKINPAKHTKHQLDKKNRLLLSLKKKIQKGTGSLSNVHFIPIIEPQYFYSGLLKGSVQLY